MQDALQALPCRHLLLILDCCFSGAFQWASRMRAIGSLMPKRIYKERFDRFVLDPAWQVITSAAYDQKAMDVLQGRATGDRGLAAAANGEAHSPFALALFEALAGEADFRTGREGDGVITATEVYAYVRDRVEPETLDAGQSRRQTPGFFPLRKHDKGEFVFLHPEAPAEPAADSVAQSLQGAAVLRRGRPVAVLRARPRDSRAAGALRRGPAAGGERRVGHAASRRWSRPACCRCCARPAIASCR